jgi:hypothetical protein
MAALRMQIQPADRLRLTGQRPFRCPALALHLRLFRHFQSIVDLYPK